MNLYHESDGPSLDHGLRERLKRLDSRLKLTYSSFAIDPQSGQPIHDALTGAPVSEPAHHLWYRQLDGQWHHCDMFPMDRGGFGYLNMRFLEINKKTTETLKPEQLFHLMEDKRKVKQELEKRGHADYRQQRAKANAKRIGDLVFHGKSGERQARISSYPGQTNHSTPGTVLSDAREDGWEL